MKRCSRHGCAAEAAVIPQIAVWAKGYARDAHPPALASLGLYLCDAHGAEATVDSLLSDEGKVMLDQQMTNLGRAAPSWKTAEVRLVPLNGGGTVH